MRDTARGRWIFGGLILLCALLSAGCSLIEEWLTGDEWRSPRVVKVTGVKKLCPYPPSWCITPREGRPAGVLARDGDLFSASKEKEGVPFLYRETDGESLVLDIRGDMVFLNGKAVTIQLSDSTGWEWLRKASVEDLASLRLLFINVKTETLDFSLLEKVARVRPNVGLFLDRVGQSKSTDLVVRLVTLFEPRFLFINLDVLSAQFDALEPRLAKLETLWIHGEGSLDFLPRLPRLRTLLLNNWVRAGSGEIPAGSRTLRSLTIMKGEKKVEDLSFLRNVTGLRELVLWRFDDLKDITALAAFPDLKKLDIFFVKKENISDLSVLERLPKLAWLKFPWNTTQKTFAKVIASHPDLEIIALGSEHIRDLSPLQSLRHPRAAILLFLKEDVDLAPLHELKSLEYLGLNEKAFKGQAAKKTEALEKALPDTFVAQVQPFCLGSGWILLLLPAIVLFRRLWPRGQGLRVKAHA
ncbi:MAG: hypothetical protein OEP48_06800 [Betaproteobacteria bacterium]|nr:hypothetical protein [Betaproteobacteria bacterium]